MTFGVGDWVKTYTAGIWQVYRILDYKCMDSMTGRKAQKRTVFSRRFVSNSFKRSFKEEAVGADLGMSQSAGACRYWPEPVIALVSSGSMQAKRLFCWLTNSSARWLRSASVATNMLKQHFTLAIDAGGVDCEPCNPSRGRLRCLNRIICGYDDATCTSPSFWYFNTDWYHWNNRCHSSNQRARVSSVDRRNGTLCGCDCNRNQTNILFSIAPPDTRC
jgi:hypothetical protein